jgi:hypothetical protein
MKRCPETPVIGVSGHRIGALGRIRTCDLPLRRRLLYPLSYEGGSLGRTERARRRDAGRQRAVGNGGSLPTAIEVQARLRGSGPQRPHHLMPLEATFSTK